MFVASRHTKLRNWSKNRQSRFVARLTGFGGSKQSGPPRMSWSID
ncbi:hypothetical protein BSY18_4087 (plasmid) [Blastomonas sp. RAC04]|nr:hypothetical protein BSY18_4087 [Blastomonas sp. RAC04]